MKDADHLELFRQIKAGEKSAEASLFRKYQVPILWKTRRQIHADPETIRDIVSDILAEILTTLHKKDFDPYKWESLDALAWGITQNKIRNWFRHQKVVDKYNLREELNEELVQAADQHLVETNEVAQLVKDLLKTLAPKYREVLILRYLKELSISEIGEKVGLPERRVSERIHYALKLMNNECQKRGILSISSILGLFPMWCKAY
ncbi:MAG: sigma-70 family RNA polymerase sigma factor [Calditrichaeota bacterium]|nr:sigma-70 family RNA polymerase sigma factor [Calditrichota bacterium]HQU54268.1 sigma-70 family RNA polymerase sigma factor [Saprospiraceae bacterium]